MQPRSRRLQLAALTSAAALGLGLIGSAPAFAGGNHHGGPPTVVASGLDNPRQLSFTRSGDLLVAESGEGGTSSCRSGPEGGTVCFGTTGAITKVSSRGRQSRILTGLPSIADQSTGGSATGPSDVAAERGGLTVLIGLGGTPEVRAALPAAGRRMGTLVQTSNGRSYRTLADLAAWEGTNNPVEDVDSNPVGLLAENGRYVIADAGGNTVLGIGRRGGIRQLAAFESRLVDAPPFLGLPPGTQIPMQAVPTSVATRGDDGAYYVSQLTGFPFPKGAANIYRIDPRSGRTTVYAAGLTNVTDLAFRGRTLYAVQLASDGLLNGPIGSVVRIERGGEVPADHTVVAGGLPAPYGIAIRGRDAYVSTHSNEKNIGEVVRIRL